ncbi:Cof-type HAD-IIB family hydrolase [Sporolituus thermophilus]|uniref:Uncharacterized protein n=1 Tax=Sporolituus thermophilus DSM 23256 TaxID=1123285 RepID=A0A1G7MPE2_9FIRM|nr:Cof-type HAD-IIB family hydrolase [Sporolituus thermophilus]SDF62979.1 hypothetical protein SAMN05660235_02233 [Sporolituus thermophilus DSM 23256]
MSIKLIAVDLDDTLLDNSLAVSARAREAIAQAVAQGITVTVATGRMYRSALPYARQLGLDVPLITYNGALIKAALSGEVLLHRPLAEDVAHEVLAFSRQRGWYIQVYLDDVLYVTELNERALYYETIAGVKAVPVGDRLYDLPGAPTKLLVMAEPADILRIQEEVQARFGDRLYAVVSKPNYLEMVHPAVNKGAALAFLAEMLGISRDEVMAIGDSHNDLDMLEYAGFGVAMGNASERVKAVAQAVTRGNDEDGVAEAIEKILGSGLTYFKN